MKRPFLTIWGPFLAALVIIFWLSSMSRVPGANYFWDKFLHAFGYAGLGILALRAFHGGFTPARLLPTLLADPALVDRATFSLEDAAAGIIAVAAGPKPARPKARSFTLESKGPRWNDVTRWCPATESAST